MKRAALVCVVLLPLAWAGCNAILGNDDGVYVPGGSDASNGDAPMQGDHTAPPDAPARDAPANVDAGGDAMTTADSGGDGDAATTPDAGDGSSSDAGEDADGAGPSDASTCDANFGTDPDNCGECGRVCGADAGCHSGLCDPIVVVGGLNGPSAISADTSGVYFSTTGTSSGGDAYATEGVFSCPSSGCAGGPATLAIDQKSPVAIALGPSTVYWLNADANDLVSCAKTGCSGLPVELTAQAGSYLTSLTIGAGTLYWTDGVGNVVSSCSTSGTCATPTQVAKLNASTSPGPISFLGATVFFANNVTGAGSVMSCAGSGCGTSPMTLVPSVASPLAVFADVSGVYFTSAASGLERVSLDGGEIGDGGSLLNGLFYPSGLVVDGRYAFVADSAGGSVWRVTLDGSSIPVAIATSQNSPTQVAVDATWVYWTNSGSTRTNGSVMKAAK